MTNPRSAYNAWTAIKKKVFSDLPAVPKRKGKPDDSAASPAKKPKGGKTIDPVPNAATPAAAAEADSDAGDDTSPSANEAPASPVKPKRSRKTKAASTNGGDKPAAKAGRKGKANKAAGKAAKDDVKSDEGGDYQSAAEEIVAETDEAKGAGKE
jgi:hypothetical protein